MAEQDYFDFGEPAAISAGPLPAAEEPVAELAESSEPKWNWWDPWPADLTRREQYFWQIRRDRRALLEETDDEWWMDFYASRIVAFQEEIKKMDSDERCSQQTPPAAVPRGGC